MDCREIASQPSLDLRVHRLDLSAMDGSPMDFPVLEPIIRFLSFFSLEASVRDLTDESKPGDLADRPGTHFQKGLETETALR